MSKEKKEKHFIHKPQYEGGPSAIKEFVTKNLQYPEAAFNLKGGIEDVVAAGEKMLAEA